MYLHITKIKINIYIFYTSYGTAMNGQSIPLSHLIELKSECSNYCHLYWNYGLYVHRKQNPWEAIRLFFFSSSSALLGGSQFWGSGCKTFAPYSLPSSPHPSPLHLQARRRTEKHPKHLCTQVQGLHLGEWRVYQVQKMVQVSSDALFSPRKFHSCKSHWFLCFSPTFFLEQGLITVGVGG